MEFGSWNRNSAMAAEVDSDKCTGCGLCVEVCPVEAIKLKDDDVAVVN
ncbi:MAG: 4Fe-4S binding protein, partial [Desulfobacterales bacterium]|nr:4Fe-4S binding protein [Desulfobacterales bacterium]